MRNRRKSCAINNAWDLLSYFEEDLAYCISPFYHKSMKKASRFKEPSYNPIFEPLKSTRLAKECDKLDVAFETAMAEEGLAKDLLEWPEND